MHFRTFITDLATRSDSAGETGVAGEGGKELCPDLQEVDLYPKKGNNLLERNSIEILKVFSQPMKQEE